MVKRFRPFRRSGRLSASPVLADRLLQRLSDDVYAVYTDFQNAGVDSAGGYTLAVGYAMPPDTSELPPHVLTHAVAPASLRAVFSVEPGRFDQVGTASRAAAPRVGLPRETVPQDLLTDICLPLAARGAELV